MNTKVLQKIKSYCEKNHMFQQGDRVVAGLSGGADSVFLCLVLKELAKEWNLFLHLVHVNHGIRGQEAEADEAFCRQFATNLEVPITVFHGDVPALVRSSGMSEEEAGRVYRYQCMEQFCEREGFHKLAVAHHRDDQAETVLFQLLRGSSLRGLGGMRPVRGRLVRPLLEISRQEIEQSLCELEQSWCEDSTNRQLQYSRNRIRQQVLPFLEKEVAPGATEHLAHTAKQLQEVFDYLSEQTQEVYSRLVNREGNRWNLETGEFLQLPAVLQRELVMLLFEQAAGSRKDITRRHVDSFCLLSAGETGKRLTLPYGLEAGKDYGMVWLAKRLDEKKPGVRTEKLGQDKKGQEVCAISLSGLQPGEQAEYFMDTFRGEKLSVLIEKFSLQEILKQNYGKVPKNNCTKWFDYARINGMLEFRHPQDGDFFWLDQNGSRKKLSRFLIDQKIPLEQRKGLWVLALGKHIVWIPELGRSSAAFYVTEETQDVVCVRMEMG